MIGEDCGRCWNSWGKSEVGRHRRRSGGLACFKGEGEGAPQGGRKVCSAEAAHICSLRWSRLWPCLWL